MIISTYAQENKEKQLDKLDILDQQSKNFFKSITGLEKDYLEEQISQIKDKKNTSVNNGSNIINDGYIQQTPKVTQEEYEKKVFEHQNDMARLTSDFTRTKKLKDIKINSMYSFNGKDYVILKLDSDKSNVSKDKELSSNIQGRYIKGDHILGHKIIKIDIRTKTIKLYKKIDDEYGYLIYLSNYGISVSDLKKENNPSEDFTKKKESKSQKIQNTFAKIPEKTISSKKSNDNDTCLYTVNVSKLNVRDTNKSNGKILRVLKINDDFTVKNKENRWLHLDTIYKKISGDVMVVENANNWVQISDTNLLVNDENCL
jgi:hypothetical protein